MLMPSCIPSNTLVRTVLHITAIAPHDLAHKALSHSRVGVNGSVDYVAAGHDHIPCMRILTLTDTIIPTMLCQNPNTIPADEDSWMYEYSHALVRHDTS